MGKGSVASKFLVILNIVYTLLGIGLVGLSVWFLIQIKDLMKLRNQYHFITSNKIYWPEALPWIYASIGLLVMLIPFCAFVGVSKKSRALLLTHVLFQVLVVLALAAAAGVTLRYADTKASDKFINETIQDAFEHMRDERQKDVKKGFEELEMWLKCCGPMNATDYKKQRNIYQNLPRSCCNTLDTDEENMIEVCQFHDSIAQSRPGCVHVVNHYVRMFVKGFAGAAILTGFIGCLNLLFAACLSGSLKSEKKMQVMEEDRIRQHRNNVAFMVAEIEKAEKVQLKE